MRRIFTLLLLLAGCTVAAQQYNNEWIQYNQTYYKFKVAQSGLVRIPKSVLDAAGIGGTPVQNFELWRNGEKVPFYPSVSAGSLPAGGYIELWGRPNDGKPDRAMYRDPANQHVDKTSVITDTAVYFLSVNTNQSGFRVQDVVNNVAGNSLPAEPYFMYTAGTYFRNKWNLGFAAVVGEYVYSSSYDKGEFWSSGNITPASNFSSPVTNLQVYTSGPASSLTFGAMGGALNPRTVKVSVNGTEVANELMDYFNDVKKTVPVATGLLNSTSTSLAFVNTSAVSTDRMVVSHYELTYPRLFNFNGQSNFEFTLPAKPAGYFLQISNFNYGSTAPVLYDVANGERYVGDLSSPGMVQFALPGSAIDRKLLLVNVEAANIKTVTDLTSRTFIRYLDVANQGDYMIVSHSSLFTGTTGNNPVNDYKAYRESPAGGSHKVIVADIDQLVDQFAFGIKKHPLSVRNFIQYARTNWANQLKNVFLIGRGMITYDYQLHQNAVDADKLNIIPTFGVPGSDNLLGAPDLSNPISAVSIGRLSVVNGAEIEYYLDKMKEYELVQKNAANTLHDREWMKNLVHVTGSSDPYLGTVLCNYMGTYKQIIEDTSFGGHVSTFCKTSTNAVEQLTAQRLAELFKEGISFLNYFGHSSSTTLEFNIDNPQNYDNQGKYPVFFVNGCNAGNFFTYYPQRLIVNETLSEKFVLAKQRGSIAFVASTHFGIVNYLNLYLNNLYNVIGKVDYNKTLGEINRDALQHMVNATGPYDFYARMHAEEITLHGDPALKINAQPRPDYVMEQSSLKISPAFISIAESNFALKIRMVNLGQATADSSTIEVKRQYPNGTSEVIYRARVRGLKYADSLTLDVPVVSNRDKGLNKITVSLDVDQNINEVAETNNTATIEFIIYEDEARPVNPVNFSIINTPTHKLYASTANPLSKLRTYVMEMDTTEAFNSTLKVSKTLASIGGVLEFDPGITYLDSTVYYWRIAPVPLNGGNDYLWNVASFIYINKPDAEGFNQSHYFQHLKSGTERIALNENREWKFGTRNTNVYIKNATYPSGSGVAAGYGIEISGRPYIGPGCNYNELIFNVFDPVRLTAWKNVYSGGFGLYGSTNACGAERDYNFMFNYTDAANRKKAMDFMDLIPDGYYVTIRANASPGPTYPVGGPYPNNVFINKWMDDTLVYGPHNSLYHRLLGAGFTEVDSFYRDRTFTFVYKKNDIETFAPTGIVSAGIYNTINITVDFKTRDTVGFVSSPRFGPAKAWKELVWRGADLENPGRDYPLVELMGLNTANQEVVLATVDKNTQNLDLSSIDANQYPYMRLRMRNVDSLDLTPYQLKYWRLFYTPVPEGALAPNIYLSKKDTLETGEPFKFAIAFKNIDKAAFDSILVKASILDNNNVLKPIPPFKVKPLISGDTAMVQFDIDSKDYPLNNTIQLTFNPDSAQREQVYFNNMLYHNFYVKQDKVNPLLDVTFDGVHILNRDIVSARPHIQIKLKDDAKYLLLNDTALSSIQVKYPDGKVRTFNFDNDTLRFVPATDGANNTAMIDFTPAFMDQVNPDGDEYELIVKGKDRSNNKAGEMEYRVSFRVISKAMISNLLNYPNPFSTSTAFVFTVTGSEVPQNIKIQILTVTGKIVREITKDELGPLHIGRNITEFKWDGTDQYGQKLGNGVYLYRVVTTLNGKPMEKYRADGDNTDKFFTNGYGKMYLMR
jgi:hypothetical protein